MRAVGSGVMIKLIRQEKSDLLELPQNTSFETVIGEVLGVGGRVTEEIEVGDTVIVPNIRSKLNTEDNIVIIDQSHIGMVM